MIITSFLIFSLLLYLPEANGNQDAKRLYEDLFHSYNILVRPVENSSDFLTVKLSLKLAKIVELVCNECNSNECKTFLLLKTFCLLKISFVFDVRRRCNDCISVVVSPN